MKWIILIVYIGSTIGLSSPYIAREQLEFDSELNCSIARAGHLALLRLDLKKKNTEMIYSGCIQK